MAPTTCIPIQDLWDKKIVAHLSEISPQQGWPYQVLPTKRSPSVSWSYQMNPNTHPILATSDTPHRPICAQLRRENSAISLTPRSQYRTACKPLQLHGCPTFAFDTLGEKQTSTAVPSSASHFRKTGVCVLAAGLDREDRCQWGIWFCQWCWKNVCWHNNACLSQAHVEEVFIPAEFALRLLPIVWTNGRILEVEERRLHAWTIS